MVYVIQDSGVSRHWFIIMSKDSKKIMLYNISVSRCKGTHIFYAPQYLKDVILFLKKVLANEKPLAIYEVFTIF